MCVCVCCVVFVCVVCVDVFVCVCVKFEIACFPLKKFLDFCILSDATYPLRRRRLATLDSPSPPPPTLRFLGAQVDTGTPAWPPSTTVDQFLYVCSFSVMCSFGLLRTLIETIHSSVNATN